jgi:hypothetical protein
VLVATGQPGGGWAFIVRDRVKDVVIGRACCTLGREVHTK